MIIPAICYADAIVPLINFFSKETFGTAAIALGIIILIEAYFLGRSIKQFPFRKHLVFSLIINIVSSFIGSIVIIIFSLNNPLRMLYVYSPTMILKFFAITIIIEFPVIKILYKDLISLNRAFLIDLKINILSYISLFLAQIIFLIGFSFLFSAQNKIIEKNWTNSNILNGEVGYVYNIEGWGILSKDSKDWGLKRYNLENKKWEKLNKNINTGLSWDIVGNILVYQTSEGEKYNLVIVKLPEFSVINTIPSRWFDKIKLDPTGRYVCVLEKVRTLFVKRGTETYGYPDECKMSIYSVESGQKINEFKDPILDDGLDWSPDSSKILFVNIRDRKFIPQLIPGVGVPSRISEDTLAYDPPKYIYVYDLKSNSATDLCQGEHPQWSHDGKRILFTRNDFMGPDKIFIYFLESKKEEFLFEMRGSEYKWSPTDKNIITVLPYKSILSSPFGFLTIINLKDPKMRLIIDKEARGNFVWAADLDLERK